MYRKKKVICPTKAKNTPVILNYDRTTLLVKNEKLWEEDELGHVSSNPAHVIPMLQKFYEGFFNQADMKTIAPFTGEPNK
jgi:hypothetical protein